MCGSSDGREPVWIKRYKTQRYQQLKDLKMDLRDFGLFLEFMIEIQPLIFLIISVFAVYLSFKMLSNAKASRAHEERMKLAEVKMNIRALFAKSIDNLTDA